MWPQVTSHGGKVQGHLAKHVTHIVLYPPGSAMGRRQKLLQPIQVRGTWVRDLYAAHMYTFECSGQDCCLLMAVFSGFDFLAASF